MCLLLSRHRIGWLLIVFAVLVSPYHAFAQGSVAEGHLERGLDLAHAGQLSGAEAELRQAAKSAPANPEAWSTLGTVLAMQHKLPESNEALRRAVKLDPSNLTARRYLAANLWQLQQYPEAKTNLQIILKAKPDDASAKLLLGMVSENSGDYVTAARMLASVPDEVRKQPESIAALVRSYYHLQRKEKARETLAWMSGQPAAFLGAQIADEMQDYDAARNLLASIQTTFTDHAKLESTRALVEYHAGQFVQCQTILQSLISAGNTTASMLNLAGRCYQKQGKPAEAVASLKQAIDLAPTDQTNYLDLSRVLQEQHSLPRALEVARHTVEAFPNSAPAWESQGTVESGMSQFTDAIQSYTHATQIDPSRPDGLLGLAEAQANAGLSKEASNSFEAGANKFPKDPRFKTVYAAVLLKQGETGDTQAEMHARQLLREALVLDPSLADAHFQLGNLALRQDQIAEAEKHFEEVIKLDANNAPGHFALARVYRRLGRQEDAARETKRYQELKGSDSQ
jgi:tetratricopeptide (TPR) repeat protein